MMKRDEPFVNVLKAYGAPVTREEYLNTAWAGNPPDPLGPELESMLPEELQEQNQNHDDEEE